VKSSQGEVVTRWTRHKSEKTRQWTRHLWRVHRVTSSLAPGLNGFRARLSSVLSWQTVVINWSELV